MKERAAVNASARRERLVGGRRRRYHHEPQSSSPPPPSPPPPPLSDDGLVQGQGFSGGGRCSISIRRRRHCRQGRFHISDLTERSCLLLCWSQQSGAKAASHLSVFVRLES